RYHVQKILFPQSGIRRGKVLRLQFAPALFFSFPLSNSLCVYPIFSSFFAFTH
ncbi:hypothetical protein GQ54DRAFT_295995, partial [Martensiomyces pterosporus]